MALAVGATVWMSRKPATITGETSRSWLVGDYKIPKAHPLSEPFRIRLSMSTVEFFLTREAMEAEVLARLGHQYSGPRDVVIAAFKKADDATRLKVLEALGLTLEGINV